MLQRELLRVQLTHHTKFERGSVVSLSHIFTNPPEGDEKKIASKLMLLLRQTYGKT